MAPNTLLDLDTLWIDRSDLEEIRTVVTAMMKRVRSLQAPCGMANWPILCGQRVMLVGAGKPIRPDQVRARYNDFGEITLDPFPKTSDESALFAADTDAMRIHLVSLLSHEITHVCQMRLANEGMSLLRAEAEVRSKTARQTRTFADYMAYVDHPMELAAHATQLAVEVLETFGEGLGHTEFLQRAAESWLHGHLRDDVVWQPSPGRDRDDLFQSLWARLADYAWRVYGHLGPAAPRATEPVG